MVVAIVQAYVEALSLPLGEYEVAHLAYEIERIDLKLSGGRQDQYAATFGGFNFMEFEANERVLVNPLRIKPWIVNELEASLMLFYTGVSRSSAKIIDQQIENMEKRSAAVDEAFFAVKREAVEMKAALLKGRFDFFVESMRRGWDSKKRTAESVSNASVDAIYEQAVKSGAQAGKVSGAGGGGFMMFFVDPARRPLVARAVEELGAQYRGFHFTDGGSQAWKIG
jgi:D-glycero-alpha-D-manno-heptose-7-phosphate kinase